ncbi:MAG: TetR/AcrR family transcriptional regulator [Actinomycetota bacterium]
MKRSRWTSDLHWVRPIQQDRSRKTQSALLDAAERLIGERGVEATTVADIADAANCSIGAFYHHYRDKKAVQYALFERYVDELEQVAQRSTDPARWDGARIGDIVLGYLQVSVETNRERPGFKRAGDEIGRTEAEMQSHLDKVRTLVDQGVRDLLLARRDEIAHPDPELAVTLVVDQMASMLRSRLLESPLPTRMAVRTDDEFVAEVMRSVCAYLGVDEPTE